MNLDFILGESPSRPTALVHSYLRDIDETDLMLLKSGYSVTSTTPPIKKIRHTHHRIAQLLAQGHRPMEVCAIMGYSSSRISILQNDPAFLNLLAYYTEQREQANVDVVARMAVVTTDIVELIAERVLDEETPLTNNELLKFGEFMADRSGFGTKQTVKIEHGISADDLEKLKGEVDNRRTGNVIEAQDYQRLDYSDSNSEPSELPLQEAQVELSTAERHLLSEASGEVPRKEDPDPDTF